VRTVREESGFGGMFGRNLDDKPDGTARLSLPHGLAFVALRTPPSRGSTTGTRPLTDLGRV
jgi:hypothetical protein